MNDIPLPQIKEMLSADNDVAFAYIFGSAAREMNVRQVSDLDMAVYFYRNPDVDQVYRFIKGIEDRIGENVIDLVVLNGCEDFVFRNEVLKGVLVFCRDVDLHASFFHGHSVCMKTRCFKILALPYTME